MAVFSHIAGDPMLDLINTVEWRLDDQQREEDLTSYDVLLTWCHESGLLTTDEQARVSVLAASAPHAARAELDAAIALREAAYEALFTDDGGAARHVADAYRQALTSATLTAQGDSWVWADDELTITTARHRIARGLVRLMGRDDLDRLHQCEDAACGWVYLDTSPRRNRRWCVTSDCGDRNRARAYYARQKAKKAPASSTTSGTP